MIGTHRLAHSAIDALCFIDHSADPFRIGLYADGIFGTGICTSTATCADIFFAN
jgi:hypothetical protein